MGIMVAMPSLATIVKALVRLKRTSPTQCLDKRKLSSVRRRRRRTTKVAYTTNTRRRIPDPGPDCLVGGNAFIEDLNKLSLAYDAEENPGSCFPHGNTAAIDKKRAALTKKLEEFRAADQRGYCDYIQTSGMKVMPADTLSRSSARRTRPARRI